MPRYIYGGENGAILEFPEGDVKLPPNSLYIACDRGHELLKDIDPFTARSLLGAQEFWTTEFDVDMLQRVYQRHFAKDLSQFLDTIRDHPDFSRCPNYLEWEITGKTVGWVKPSYKFLVENLP